MYVCLQCKAPRDASCGEGVCTLTAVPGLEDYQAGRYLDRGGQGVVYRCFGEGERRVIKIIDPASLMADTREKATQWFDNEVAALKRLSHPHVIALHASGRVGRLMYLVTSFLDGTLRKVLSAPDTPGRIGLPRIVRYAAQLADALTYLHDQGVFHRDVKPANIGLDRYDQIKLFDFGAAGLHTGSRLTTIGAAMSLMYAAPEQLEGRPTSAQTDIYGFGAVLYELIARRNHRPQSVGVRQNWATFYRQPIPPLPEDPGRPQALDDLIMRCLHPDAGQRMQHTWQIQETLADLADRLNGNFGAVRAQWARLSAEVPELEAKQARLKAQLETDQRALAQQTQALADVQAQIATFETRSTDAKKKAEGFEIAARDMQRQFDAASAKHRIQAAQTDALEAKAKAAQKHAEDAEAWAKAAQEAQSTAKAARQRALDEETAVRARLDELAKQRSTTEQALTTARAERDAAQAEAIELVQSRARRKTARMAIAAGLMAAGLAGGYGLAVALDDEGATVTSDAPQSVASEAVATAASTESVATAASTESVAPKTIAKPEQYAGAHILVAYKGATRAKPTITRTKEEALAKAKELMGKARGGADFAKLAGENSDGPSAKRGGSLGTWSKGRMVPAFDTAVSAMQINDISEPVETPFGYHIIKRLTLPEMRAGAHILIAYKGAMRAKPTITRTKDEALAKANELMGKARANPADFGNLAKENSDGPSAARNGSLGTWPRGNMVPEFDQAIDKMKVGDISEPVETPFGFHVIQRLDAKQ
jgi:peptidyl-prolyl cis-trans isomerase SurA